ncbi:MAG: hypothetical protein H6502_04645 [Candidatus Woesearchaeota archaeon]|nr:MAG: hypothetical protein H6502_04645 [Candidatus Woesearchaeota archaeon]
MKTKKVIYLILICSLFLNLFLFGYLFYLRGNDYFYLLCLQIFSALFTVLFAYLIYISQKKDIDKSKLEEFKSRLNNLLYELESNIEIPLKYIDFSTTFKKILSSEKFSKDIVKNLENEKTLNEFIRKYLHSYLNLIKIGKIKTKSKQVNVSYIFNKLLDDKNVNKLIIERPILTRTIEDELLNYASVELNYYNNKYSILQKNINDLKHTTNVFKVVTHILLFGTHQSNKYNDIVTLNSIFCILQYSEIYIKRIEIVVKEIMKIIELNDLSDFQRLNKLDLK